MIRRLKCFIGSLFNRDFHDYIITDCRPLNLNVFSITKKCKHCGYSIIHIEKFGAKDDNIN